MPASTVIDWDVVIARILDQDTDGFFLTVESAKDQNPPEDIGAMPAIFLVPGIADADPLADGASLQRVHPSIEANIVCSADDLQEAIALLQDILLGWEMDSAHGPFRLATTGYLQSQASLPEKLHGGVMWWKERYQNTTHTKRISYS